MERYVDAEAFDERVRIAGGFAEEELTDDFKDGILTVLEMLKTQPTADVRKVVHGKWLRIKEHEYRCSICGAGVGHAWQEKFCWTCGAEMSTDEDWHEVKTNE